MNSNNLDKNYILNLSKTTEKHSDILQLCEMQTKNHRNRFKK